MLSICGKPAVLYCFLDKDCPCIIMYTRYYKGKRECWWQASVSVMCLHTFVLTAWAMCCKVQTWDMSQFTDCPQSVSSKTAPCRHIMTFICRQFFYFLFGQPPMQTTNANETITMNVASPRQATVKSSMLCPFCQSHIDVFDFANHTPQCYVKYCNKKGITPLCTCKQCAGLKTHHCATCDGVPIKNYLSSSPTQTPSISPRGSKRPRRNSPRESQEDHACDESLDQISPNCLNGKACLVCGTKWTAASHLCGRASKDSAVQKGAFAKERRATIHWENIENSFEWVGKWVFRQWGRRNWRDTNLFMCRLFGFKRKDNMWPLNDCPPSYQIDRRSSNGLLPPFPSYTVSY